MIADFKILNDADIITRRRLVIWGRAAMERKWRMP